MFLSQKCIINFHYIFTKLFSAIPALTLPVIIVGGIVGGYYTDRGRSVAVITGLFISFLYIEK